MHLKHTQSQQGKQCGEKKYIINDRSQLSFLLEVKNYDGKSLFGHSFVMIVK